ncbi:DNA-binding protein [Escherichia coli]|nr:DNA-binding protein [Escherichia coli]EFJ5616295.1 DNA-binding protein [Escherichia coli]
MALVSVTEAARLTGKNRATIHRYIKQGKLSQMSDATNTKKVDTSELIRVFGSLTATHATPKTDQSVALLQQKIALLEQLLESKNNELQRQDEHIDSLKQAMLLIESKLPTTPEPVAPVPAKKSWQFWKK